MPDRRGRVAGLLGRPRRRSWPRRDDSGTAAGEPVQTGWMLWPPIPYQLQHHQRHRAAPRPRPPTRTHWLGTDDTARDVLARVIYGFRLSVTFALIVTALTSVIGIAAGAVQGYFGGLTDLIFQRIIEIWGVDPQPLRHHHRRRDLADELLAAGRADGAVRLDGAGRRGAGRVPAGAELRICPRRPRAWACATGTIMFRHVLPNAMVATLTMLPFIITGTIGSLAALDFLGFGLPSSSPSLGELTLQAQAEPAGAVAGLHRLLHLRHHAVACWSSSSKACAMPLTRERPSDERAGGQAT